MQIRKLTIKNFRGISNLEWTANEKFCCIIGSGDSGKTSVLDAIEATLSSRWYNFSEADFFNCDTTKTIEIEATIGELSKYLKSDERFGLYVRGWSADGVLNDEPEGEDEPVLTVRLSIDTTLEPVWELVCDRVPTQRILSNRDRLNFGLVRLSGEDERHLSWGNSSILSRLTGDKSEATTLLAEVYKTARESIQLDKIDTLSTTAKLAEKEAKALGAYVDRSYVPGLELGRSGVSSGSITLHDGGVPLKMAGLGTRRLVTLAIQRSAILEGAIILIDEIEHGLEPHRIIGAISQLKRRQAESFKNSEAIGQIFMTTHSDIALVEVGSKGLFVCQNNKQNGKTEMISPESPDPINAILRFNPRALLARRILFVEGSTEEGLILGMRGFIAENHDGVSIEQMGVAISDGNGNECVHRALTFSRLGYEVAIFRDSDEELSETDLAALKAENILVIQYEGKINTEQAVLLAANDQRVQELIDYFKNERSSESIEGSLMSKIQGLDAKSIKEDFSSWSTITGKGSKELRELIASTAASKNQKWFKDKRVAREIAALVWIIASEDKSTSLAKSIIEIEKWMYA